MFGIRFNEIALVIAILAVLAITVVLDSNRSYVTNPQVNAVEIGRQTALLGIFALGAMVVIVSGGIDLSAGSMIAFSGAVIACTMLALKTWSVTAGLPEWSIVVLGISAGMFSGFLVGTLHAWLVTCIGLPPFVATLSTLVGLRSLARILCEFTTITAVGAKKRRSSSNKSFLLGSLIRKEFGFGSLSFACWRWERGSSCRGPFWGVIFMPWEAMSKLQS